MITGLIITLTILIVLSGLFSATETAYTSMNIARMKNFATTKRSARRALRLSENYDRLLTSLLIGNNVVNITAASIGTVIFVNFFGESGVLISTILITVVVLVFSEITPKSLAKERPEAFAMFISLPLLLFCAICTPLNWLFNLWKKFLIKILRLEKKQPALTEEEFKIMIDEIKSDGVLSNAEHQLIHNTLKYDEMKVSDVMTPINEITMIELKTQWQEIKHIFEQTNYSRIPIYKDKKGNVIGILYRADFYELMLNQNNTLQNIIKPVMWISPNEKISTLFSMLQKRKEHIAMVGVAQIKPFGLITLEDILEELVGEIEDKHDE